MLRLVKLADQWREIQSRLPEGWTDARLEVVVREPARYERAAVLLASLTPVRRENRFRFYAARRGAGPSPSAVERALEKLDEEWVQAELKLLGSDEEVAAPAPTQSRAALTESWDAQLEALPPDWSDLYAEVELTSTDHLDRSALLMAPLNPSRFNDQPAFRFRCARRFGYGASPGMVRRCLERLDAEGIRGEVRILWALSDTQPVATQGPVWYVGGKAV
jgi:hypothetical protein